MLLFFLSEDHRRDPQYRERESMVGMRTTLCLIFACALTIPALAMSAEIPEPGIRYRVTGVSDGDQLNIRAQPGADGELTGALAPGARDLIVTGSRQKIAGSIWWELVDPSDEFGTGWVNARFLAPETTSVNEETNYRLDCGGTEPFWSLVMNPNGARYSLSGADELTFSVSPWVEARGLRGHFIVKLNGDTSPQSEGVLAVLRDYNFCSDGMSDTDFPFHATLILPNGDVFGGCCSRAAH